MWGVRVASGCILGNCPVCDELVWEDEWDIFDDIIMHEDCKKAYIKKRYGMNEDQFNRLCGASQLKKEIADTVQSLKDSTEFYLSKLAALENRLLQIEHNQKEEHK